MTSIPKQAKTYYAILGLTPWATEIQIRQAYRELSKLYHPDTTQLEKNLAIEKFRQINDAYATLSNPERRNTYDQMIRFSRLNYYDAQGGGRHPDREGVPNEIENRAGVWTSSTSTGVGKNTYRPLQEDDGLPSQRPLSGGELFVLFLFAMTFLACALLALSIAWWRKDALLPQIQSVRAIGNIFHDSLNFIS
jgi:curved DNA-binding protein CbpA